MTNNDVYRSSKAKPRFFYGYIVVIAAFFTQVLMLGSHSSFGVFFKPMLIEFGWTRALTSGAYSISMIIQGLVSVVMGGLNDRFGPRIVMTICGFLVSLGLLLMSQISAAWQLYLFFSVILGIGMGGVYVPTMSTVARWFVKRRGVAAGIVIAGGGTGILIMPLVANWLIYTYGWRNAYIISGALVLIIIIFAAQFLRRDPAQMGLLPYGENKEQEQEYQVTARGLSLKETIHTIQFWMLITILFCFGLGVSAILVHIVPHAIDLGISATTAAGILSTIGVVIVAGSVLMGGLADRIGIKPAFIICFILMAAAFCWLLIAREVWMLYLFAVLMGLADGGNTAIYSPLVAELFGIRSHGLILGVCFFCSTIGAAIGPFIAGYVFDASGSYQLSFIILAIASVVGLILAAILKPVKKSGTQNY